ncbi:MAG: WecB/TagA/CpsF family glycosyltransferase [Coriobacteriia bacterium]|nr:WecB/TagA/CpsF family glycosyltransferase [Coriobacteriia bacterium]
MKHIEIMESRVDVVSSQELARLMHERLKGVSAIQISKINTEMLHRAMHNERFRDSLGDSDLNIADGRGVLLAARYLSLPVSASQVLRCLQAVWQMARCSVAIVSNSSFIAEPIAENIPGVDALKLMLRSAEQADSGVFFFGAHQSDLDAAVSSIRSEMPDLRISGALDGYGFQSDPSVDPVEIINGTDAKLLIVALGSPLQEYWIRDNLAGLKGIRVAVGEGGSLAFLAGTQKRAPKWMQDAGLEWLWRTLANKSLTHQTGSRVGRVWNAVPVFMCEMVRWKAVHGAIRVEADA